MIKLLLTTLCALSLSISLAQHYNEKYGQPIVVLIETDPWLMVIGSDVPTFALYENGQVIYRKVVNNSYQYFQVSYDREKTQSVIKSLGITDALMGEPKYNRASFSTDQPTNILLLNFDSLVERSVYGRLRESISAAREKTPQAFLTVYDNIIKFEDPTAEEWLPDSIEVMATRYSYSPAKPVKWKSEWSDIKSPTTVRRGDDLYSIYLDKKYFPEFIKLLKSLKQKQAVEINGEKYSLSYRLPFPNLR